MLIGHLYGSYVRKIYIQQSVFSYHNFHTSILLASSSSSTPIVPARPRRAQVKLIPLSRGELEGHSWVPLRRTGSSLPG
jgi:hypothetical protein